MVKNIKSRSAEKRLVTLNIIQESNVLIFFDPRDENVTVPDVLRDKKRTALEFGLDLPKPILDLVINEMGIGGTLSFGGKEYYCWVPWDKVFCITVSGTDRGKEWVDDIPSDDELLINALSNHSANNIRKKFKLIHGEGKNVTSKYDKDRSHLRLIK